MKSYFALPLVIASLALGAVSASAQTVKIGTVDMNRILHGLGRSPNCRSSAI